MEPHRIFSAQAAENIAHQAGADAETRQLHIDLFAPPGQGIAVFAELAEKAKENPQPEDEGEQEQALQPPGENHGQARGQVAARQGEDAADEAHHQGGETDIVAAMALIGGIEEMAEVREIVAAPTCAAVEADRPNRPFGFEEKVGNGDEGDQ